MFFLKGLKYIGGVVPCFRFVSPLDIPRQQQAKKVSDGHGRSYISLQWQKIKGILG